MSTANLTQSNQVSQTSNQVPLWAKAIALLTLLNLILGLFNISYVPLRDIYLKYLPAVVRVYDPIKGIEANTQTENYLVTVKQLVAQLPEKGLIDQTTKDRLASLRSQSVALIEENPFMVGNKFATFAKIQRRMRERVGVESTREAFLIFWSIDYLMSENVIEEIDFFESKISPLIRTNYFRNTDVTGQFVDDFWRIDLFFIVFFAGDFLLRSLIISRKNPSLSWGDGMLRRWYDIFLLLPVWRWLRILPVTIRLHKAKIINLEGILAQITHEPAAYLADRVAEFVTLRLINQTQESIQKGDMAKALLSPQPGIKVSDVDGVEVISNRLLDLTVYRVLPRIQPQIESLLHHSLESAIKQNDFYEIVGQIPTLGNLPDSAIKQLSIFITDATYDVISASYSDLEGRELFDSLAKQFQDSLRKELQNEETLREIQSLLSDLLEEMKLNYIQNSRKLTPEQMIDEMAKVKQVALDTQEQEE
ncbi:MAG: hypothetical protein F6K22_07315 [Okeania sp. SIO2F4]|uniref:hypothetical protein n=1 Tax=Okeania sp. SIO2F4 TaxID=2607790 RepID=UPI00142C8E39|nr:hypothetical protein [Okeania sp. SIO2F4]NES02670.1 hypothetical protein [Okeania sp. SIO2F4]